MQRQCSLIVWIDLSTIPTCSCWPYLCKVAGQINSSSWAILNSLSPCVARVLKPQAAYIFMTVSIPVFIVPLVLFGPLCTVRKFILDDLVCRKGILFTKKKSTYSCISRWCCSIGGGKGKHTMVLVVGCIIFIFPFKMGTGGPYIRCAQLMSSLVIPLFVIKLLLMYFMKA